MQYEKEFLRNLYRNLLDMRLLEQKMVDTYAQGRVPGHIHSGVGQEASFVGVLANFKDGDYYKRIVNANFGAALRGLNSFESIAVSMAEGHFQGYDPYRFPEIYDSITVEDVLAFLRDNFTRQHMALSVIAPSEEV